MGGKRDINAAVRRSVLGGKGITILISDFLEEEGLEEAIRYLVYQRQEVFLIQVLAREETDFDDDGTLELVDAEDAGSVRVTMSRQSIRMYTEALHRHETKLKRLAKRYGCTFLRVVSDEEPDKVIFETQRNNRMFE